MIQPESFGELQFHVYKRVKTRVQSDSARHAQPNVSDHDSSEGWPRGTPVADDSRKTRSAPTRPCDLVPAGGDGSWPRPHKWSDGCQGSARCQPKIRWTLAGGVQRKAGTWEQSTHCANYTHTVSATDSLCSCLDCWTVCTCSQFCSLPPVRAKYSKEYTPWNEETAAKFHWALDGARSAQISFILRRAKAKLPKSCLIFCVGVG
jgi:hypothetical protein